MRVSSGRFLQKSQTFLTEGERRTGERSAMAIETLQDILTEVADRIGVYGAHGEPEDEPCNPQCRMCFEFDLRQRILNAVEVERKLYPTDFNPTGR